MIVGARNYADAQACDLDAKRATRFEYKLINVPRHHQRVRPRASARQPRGPSTGSPSLAAAPGRRPFRAHSRSGFAFLEMLLARPKQVQEASSPDASAERKKRKSEEQRPGQPQDDLNDLTSNCLVSGLTCRRAEQADAALEGEDQRSAVR